MTGGSWDAAYQSGTPPWEIGRPQPAIVRVADAGELVEPILDSGCGTGEHALLAASMGFEATGVDVAQSAIERARAKARQRGLPAQFLVGDVLALDQVERLEPPFRTVIDTGCFHTFDDADRRRYVGSLASVLEPGAVVHLLCFSEHTPGLAGPRRVTQAEIREAFAVGWQVDRIDAEQFAISSSWSGAPPSAWLARIVRL